MRNDYDYEQDYDSEISIHIHPQSGSSRLHARVEEQCIMCELSAPPLDNRSLLHVCSA